MKILIFEDEAPAARRMIKLINECDASIRILEVIESVKDGIEWLAENELPDLIISDIQLSDNLSFEIFKAYNLKIPVVFTTAYNEYAIEAFNHYSIDYLLKPIKLDDLKKSLSKHREFGIRTSLPEDLSQIISKIKGDEYRTRFLVYYKDTLIPIECNEIAYFYSDYGTTFLMHRNGKKYSVSESLDTLEHQLDPRRFFRANRKYMLSVESIQKVEPYFNQKLAVQIVPAAGEQLTISKLKATAFKNWLNS